MLSYLSKFYFILSEKKFTLYILIVLFIFSSILEVIGVGAAGLFLKYLFDENIPAIKILQYN